MIAVLCVLAFGSQSSALRPNTTLNPCQGSFRTAAKFSPWAKSIWKLSRWERGQPKQSTIAAYRQRLRCAAGPGHRKAMKHRWRTEKKAFGEHRRKMLWRVSVTPFYGCTSIGGCGWFALPVSVVECESGGRFNDPSAPNGAYSLLTGPLQDVPTWETYRPGWASGYAAPYQAPRKAQDIAAHRLYVAYGLEPWTECA